MGGAKEKSGYAAIVSASSIAKEYIIIIPPHLGGTRDAEDDI